MSPNSYLVTDLPNLANDSSLTRPSPSNPAPGRTMASWVSRLREQSALPSGEPGAMTELQAEFNSAGRYLVCRAGALIFALRAADVLEIRPVPHCTHAPGTSDETIGVANIDGTAVCVLDVSVLAGFGPADPASWRLLVVQTPGLSHPVGLVTDQLLDLTLMSELSTQGISHSHRDHDPCGLPRLGAVRHYDGQPISVLDLETMLTPAWLQHWRGDDVLARNGAGHQPGDSTLSRR